MADYTKLNLRQDVEDMAPRFGYAPNVEARFARKTLGLANSGVSYFKIAPGFRMPFGHRHARHGGRPGRCGDRRLRGAEHRQPGC